MPLTGKCRSEKMPFPQISSEPLSFLLLHLRQGVSCRRGLLLNSFKHILNNTITPHGMEIECFLPLHSSTRVKTLAQQRPRSMEADAVQNAKTSRRWPGNLQTDPRANLANGRGESRLGCAPHS